MRAVVVYESMFGDTRQIAEAVGDGLGLKFEVTVMPVNHVATEQLRGADLPRIRSRHDADPSSETVISRVRSQLKLGQSPAAQPESGTVVEPGAAGPGLREWFTTLTDPPLHAAAFDTRVQMSPLVTGRAAPKISRSLQRSGCHLIAEPESFLVTMKNPTLVVGEWERARAWGEILALAATPFLARSGA